ncbi:MAG: YfbK domain-containing protein, partial [Pseudomonas sp.]|uniref:YfbK domain-containing protein n=1 Tax=Pseudomonas sp. TaxID=306 RepID=UPI0033976902
KGWLEPLRYQPAVKSDGKAGELALLRIRYKAPGQPDSRLLEVPIAAEATAPAIAAASKDLRFAAAVAGFAQQLSGGQYTGTFGLAASAELARGAKGDDRFGLRGEFIQLVELAQSLQPASTAPPTSD